MKTTSLVLKVVLVCCLVSACSAVTGRAIGDKARSYVGSQRWLYNSSYSLRFPANTNKCNLFVADVLSAMGCNAPERHWYNYSPIAANTWANSHSSDLVNDNCWERCTNGPQVGDVIAIEGHGGSGHVGIVSLDRMTTSAAWTASPPGLVVENDWGFRAGQHPTCWRCKC